MKGATIMGKNDEKNNNKSKPICRDNHIKLTTHFHNLESQQELRASDALRTYATWLVRATRRKMAVYEPENVPKKSPN
jgi:hypothetical protein